MAFMSTSHHFQVYRVNPAHPNLRITGPTGANQGAHEDKGPGLGGQWDISGRTPTTPLRLLDPPTR